MLRGMQQYHFFLFHLKVKKEGNLQDQINNNLIKDDSNIIQFASAKAAEKFIDIIWKEFSITSTFVSDPFNPHSVVFYILIASC